MQIRVILYGFVWFFCSSHILADMQIIAPNYNNSILSKNTVDINARLVAYFRENPLNEDVTFLACHWYAYDHGAKDKNTLYSMPKITTKYGFAVVQQESYLWMLPILAKLGIKTLFVTHLSKSRAFKTIDGVTLVPFPHVAIIRTKPAEYKDILYSFVGSITHPIRKKLFTMKHPRSAVMIQRDTKYFFNEKNNEIKALQVAEYKNILSRSRFSLCPRGYSPNSFRLWESLEAGAIPILISDELSLPDGFDWDSCIIRVPEKMISQIPLLLSKISPEQEAYMREQCYKAFSAFQEENLTAPIRRFYATAG